MNKNVFCLILVFASVTAALPVIPLSHALTGQPTVALSPSSYSPTQVNQVFQISITISNVQGLWGWAVDVNYNPQILNLTKVTEGNFLTSQVGTTLFFSFPLAATPGAYDINDASASTNTANGTGTLATLTFQVISRFSQTTIQSNFTLQGVAPTVKNPNGTETKGTIPTITPTSSTAQSTITLQTTLPPVANAGQNQTVRAGTQVVLNGSLSISNGNNPTYTWTFQDVTQQTLTGIIATYTFKNPGIFLVTLTVKDSLGSDTSTVTITVINSTYTQPTITVSGDQAVGEPITFTIDTNTLRDVPVKNYLWSMGNKSPPIKTSNNTETYAYPSAGTYTVNVTISYIDGLNDFATTNVTVGQSSQPISSPTPAASSNPNLNSSNSPTPNSSAGTGVNDASVSLPPTIIGIIVAITIFILVGSVFWLRNQKTYVSNQQSSPVSN